MGLIQTEYSSYLKNYETYYRSARVQVLNNLERFWSILNYIEPFSHPILVNLSLFHSNSIYGGNLLKRVQWKKIYEIMKYCCCATKNEFNNTAWAQGFKKYLRASLFLHNLRVLVTFMIMSRRNVLLFFWHCFWKHNEILCFPVLKH